jgi:hypothetical protein
MSSITLYKLAGEYQRLMDLATDDEADHSMGLPQEFVETLESLEGEITTKLEGCCRAVKSMVSLKNAIDEEAAALRLRASRLDKAVEELKGYMQYNLEQMEIKKVTAGIFKLTICQNSQPSVIVLDLDAVPSKFDKPQERQVSLTQIRDAVKAGEQVPGVDVVHGSHLRIA